ATQQQRAFDLLPSGAAIVGLGELMGAGHFSFSDICEVPRNLVGAIGGFDEACEPRHLPWRWARRLVGYLAVNFFHATLRGDADGRARLAAAVGGTVDDVVYRDKVAPRVSNARRGRTVHFQAGETAGPPVPRMESPCTRDRHTCGRSAWRRS